MCLVERRTKYLNIGELLSAAVLEDKDGGIAGDKLPQLAVPAEPPDLHGDTDRTHPRPL